MRIIIKKLKNPDKFKAWGKELQGPRNDEAILTLKEEGTISEGFYSFEINGEKYAIGYQIINPNKKQSISNPSHPIDIEHRAIKAESLGEIIPTETIYQLDNFDNTD